VIGLNVNSRRKESSFASVLNRKLYS